ncbi:Nrap protein [Hypoxylon sp. FL0890]|nr:Nrap protein [Hypoxylon sp. FL0890]
MQSNTAKRRKLDHAARAPTFEAMSSSASAMGASGASAFIMQTEELLKETKFDYSKVSSTIEDTVRQFKDVIEKAQPHDPLPIGEVTAQFEESTRIIIPYPDPKPAEDSPYKLSFERPAQVNVVGSWVLKTNVNSQSDLAIDMIVEMPPFIFQEKDYLNMRYFYKRSYYLAYITSTLRKAFGASTDFVFEHLHGNQLLPILVARPKDTSHKNGDSNHASSQRNPKPAIRIIPCISEPLFPWARLTTASNAIRPGKSEVENTEDAKAPTPFYNTTLKAESKYLAYLRILLKAAHFCPAFRDACVLGRVWLQQRGFSGKICDGGFGHFEWALLMAFLLETGGRKGDALLSPSLHSTQLFKATLQCIATTKLLKQMMVFCIDPPDVPHGINVLYKMTPWSIALLTEQAKWSLSAMNDNPHDQFDPLFIINADQPLQMFDMLLSVHVPASRGGVESVDRKGFVFDFGAKLYQTLKQALGERAKLIHLNLPGRAAWPISSTGPNSENNTLLVGVVVDPLKASQAHDYGPALEQKEECEEFRDFWGDKSELLDFGGNRIVESLDWTEFSYLGFSGICEGIIRYILKFQLQLGDTDLEFYWKEIPKIMSFTSSDKLAFDGARQAFEIFERDVRDLEDLPLHVKQIAPICSDLRRTSLSIPEFNFRKPLLQPMEVVVSFELSGRWPENIAAIQRAKAAFLLKIGRSLEEAKEEIRTHIGLESATRDDENLAFLDVVYENGASFRLRVHSDLEESLLERRTKDKTVERHIRTEASELLSSYKRMYTNLPLHNQTLSTFCTRFPALSSSIRLTKHWFDSHKLSCHFGEELIELFVLQAFLKPYPWDTPCSAMTGFMRTLFLLSRWDWRDEPLIVDSANSLSTSQRLEIGTRLQAWRKIDPNMNRTVMFVATSHDVNGTAYTLHGPSRVVATRMTTLARAACDAVKVKGVDLNVHSLFRPALRDYDVLLRLSPRVLKSITRDDATRRSQYANLNEQNVGKAALPLVEPPARTLLKKLNSLYSNPLLFFHGAPDDNIIAGLWSPLMHKRKFTMHMPCSLQLADEQTDSGEQLYEVNRNAILAEIARIGGDLIEKIEVKEG